MRTLHPERTALLASVLSAEEVPAALSGGADIMDVKNPAEGALGAPSPATVRAVRAATPAELHVSAALGDMPDLPGTAALAAVGAASAGASIVKVGLYGPSTEEAVCRLLGTVAAALAAESPATALVAGVYPDAPLSKGINPLSVPRCAAEAGVAGCLLD
ncbi:MAG: (5-formylfuran-3-yl)methyl phosphate synthase, partial [Synergistales bacterium]|nr:(5-formylfuran-3-yl)methyl phosphate synthase [Synergistales bacterium]